MRQQPQPRRALSARRARNARFYASESEFQASEVYSVESGHERAITNLLTMDVAYVGVHGYDEAHSIDLNEAPVGTGWDLGQGQSGSAAANCAAASLAALTGASKPAQPIALRILPRSLPRGRTTPSSLISTISLKSTNGFRSNYDGVSVSLNARNYHGWNFLASYTFSHALDDFTNSGQATSQALANPANPQYQYGNSDLDVRNRFRFSPTYQDPGDQDARTDAGRLVRSALFGLGRPDFPGPRTTSPTTIGPVPEKTPIRAFRGRTTGSGKAGITSVLTPHSAARVSPPFPVTAKPPTARPLLQPAQRYSRPAWGPHRLLTALTQQQQLALQRFTVRMALATSRTEVF